MRLRVVVIMNVPVNVLWLSSCVSFGSGLTGSSCRDKALIDAIKSLTQVTQTEMSIDSATANEIVDQVYSLVDFVVLVWLVHA
jgi:hypothetical protein